MKTPWRFFRFPWRARSVIARDVDAELAFHLDMRVAELRARGLSEAAARTQATAEFGDVEFTRAYCRREDEIAERTVRRSDRFAEWKQDLSYAVRTLRRSPTYALVSLLTLAVAIGANTSVFAVSRAVLIKPLPYADADRVYRLYSSWPDHPGETVPLSPADFADLQSNQKSFTDIAALIGTGAVIYRPASGDARSLDALLVGTNIFSVLGARPLYGRAFMPGDELAGNDHKIVLSYDGWRRDFGGDTSIVGRSAQLNGASYTVLGVMPRGFDIGEGEEVWLPYDQIGTLKDVVRARKQHYLHAVGRLKPGITPEAALADLRTIAARLAQQYPDADSARSEIMRPIRDVMAGSVRGALLLLQGAALLVLLIACANLANLALSRTMARRRELATRAALGAGRGRLMRQLVTESVLLSLVGGAIGIGLAAIGTRMLLALNPSSVPSMFTVRVDGGVLAFSLVVSVVTGALFGLLPALDAVGANLHDTLKEGGRGTSGGRASGRVRNALVVAQVALALMLLTGAGLLVRSFGELTRVRLGFEPSSVMTAGLRAAGDKYDDPARIDAFYGGVIDELLRAPGVTAVGASSELPTRGGPGTALRIDGEVNDEARLPDLMFLAVRGNYFGAMRIPIVAGRAYDMSDTPDVAETAIINETAAKRFFPKGDAVGRRIRIGPDPNGAWMTIVGVAGDVVDDAIDTPVRPTLYTNHRHEAWMRSMSIVMRTSLPATDASALIRHAVRAQDPGLPVRDLMPLGDVVGASLASRRFALGLAASFAVIALLLAAVGIYGVLAYSVANRTREFGVRIALGASTSGVLALVVRQGVATSLAGIGIGLIGAMAGARLLASTLFGVSALDGVTYMVVVAVLLVVSVVACLVPAVRATRVDPLTSMRAE
jgi:predicted permease